MNLSASYIKNNTVHHAVWRASVTAVSHSL